MAKPYILSFPQRRGRPRKASPHAPDKGTPELQQKRAQQLTLEPLDLCLQLGLLSASQHWSGMHLRWLYTIKFGLPSIRTLDVSDRIASPRPDDPRWRAEREAEYAEAIALLRANRCDRPVISLCIHHERPQLLSSGTLPTPLTKGLELLWGHWGKH